MSHDHEYDHDHLQDYGDTHDHAHTHMADVDPHVHHRIEEVRPQPVVLDLGDGIGALNVHTAPELLGEEIDISPSGDDAQRQHKQVLRRLLGTRPATVLVYDNLPEGKYTLWRDGVATRGIQVTGGAVAELEWSGVS